MSVCYRCRAVGGLRPDEWGWSFTSRRRKRRRECPCMCLCTVYGSHRVHLFKNQKHYLSLFSFIIKVFAKTRNYKKKKTVFFSCALWGRDAWFLFLCKRPPSHPLWPRFSEPRLGEAVSWRFTLDLQTWRLCQPVYTHIYEYIENRLCLHIWLWGSKRGPDVSAETRDAPQVRYQVLKLSAGWFLTLFQSHFRLASFNETITIACAVCFCAIGPEKPAFCSTLDLNQREEGEVEPSGRDGWPGPSLRRALGFHQHWEAPPSPTPSSALLSTCLVLEITSSPPPSYFLRFIIVIWSHADSKATGARVKSTSQSWISRGSGGKKSWISKSLKTKVWVEYAHASSYTGYNQAYICGCMCVYG